MTLDDLLAREGIRDLVTRYNSYGDSGRFAPLFELFTDDAVMDIGAFEGERRIYNGLEDVKLIFTGAQDRVKGQLEQGKPGYIRHMTATHQIDLIDADNATGRLYFAVLVERGLDHWGRYIDRYVRVDGQWKFAHRKVIVDGQQDGGWFAHDPAERG